MNVFLIIPTASQEGEIATINQELEKRIENVVTESKNRFMLPGRSGCFVAFDGISTELRDKLNLVGNRKIIQKVEKTQEQSIPTVPEADQNAPITAVIISVFPGGYNGYALSSLWEWLNLKTKE